MAGGAEGSGKEGERKKKCSGCYSFAYLDREGKCEDCAKEEAEEGADLCGKCTRKVGKKDNGLECDECAMWFHIGCEGVALALYKQMQDHKGMLWFCKKCRPKVAKQARELKQLKEEMKGLKEENRELTEDLQKEREENKEMREKISRLQEENREMMKRMKAWEEGWEEKENRIVERAVERIEGNMMGEIEEKMQKKNKVVMFNLKEAENREETRDKEKCEEIIKESLDLYDVKVRQVTRIGKKTEGKTRPILVEMENEKEKWAVVARAKRLREARNPEWRKIGVQPDMTRKEREENKKLRAKL